MDMRDEVEQIILRSILKDGLDAVPQDYLFITKYDLKQIYFSISVFRISKQPKITRNIQA